MSRRVVEEGEAGRVQSFSFIAGGGGAAVVPHK